jgi:hypothetical protein
MFHYSVKNVERLLYFNYIPFIMSNDQLALSLAEKEAEIIRTKIILQEKEADIISLKMYLSCNLSVSTDADTQNPSSQTDASDFTSHADPAQSSQTVSEMTSKVNGPKKSKIRKITVCQKKLQRGFNDGDCSAICATPIHKGKVAFFQCPNRATSTGLCSKHEKAKLAQGGLRCGECSPENTTITADTFGTPEFIAGQVKSHQYWVKRIIHNLKNPPHIISVSTDADTQNPSPETDAADSASQEDLEKFSDFESLVDHTIFGAGPIRHRDCGFHYHGVNSESSKKEKPSQSMPPSLGSRAWNSDNKFYHCHFERPNRNPDGLQMKRNKNRWDHKNASIFCKNCIHVPALDKQGRKAFRCLGHIEE